MKCIFPSICIWCYETESQNNYKRLYCTLKDMEINYTNTEKIENCQSHKTFQQLKENRVNWSC